MAGGGGDLEHAPATRRVTRSSAHLASQLLRRLADLPGVEQAPSQFNGSPAFWIDGREFVHFHGDDVEIRLTRKLIRRLDDPAVVERTRTSDWVVVPAAEADKVVALARDALEAYR